MHKSNGLSSQAYQMVREAILRGEHAPGDALYEVALAERFGMSRTPVREALQLLVREGFVDSLPGRGYLVPRWSLSDIRELYELRESLEGFATSCAARRVTPEGIAELDALFAAYQSTSDWEAWVDLGTQFHTRIIFFGGNQRLAKSLDSLKAQISQTRISQLRDLKGRRDESTNEHELILEAIRARNPELAERHARQHIRLSYQASLRAFHLAPD